MTNFDVVIIGGGILGTTLSYFLSFLNKSKKIAVVEQAHKVAFHTSKRNTGKVHAPYLYNPETKKMYAKTAFHGYTMWERYAKLKDLPFKQDGVIEVAVDNQKDVLERHLKWGLQNGLDDNEIKLLSGAELSKIEPEIRCKSALYVSRDASVDYALFTDSLMQDSSKNGTSFLLNSEVTDIQKTADTWKITLRDGRLLDAKFLINAAGGQSVDIAHAVGVATKFTDIHFRGEYWKAPAEYHTITKSSVYSVPKLPEYPFLDPHWIIRADGSCEIGPNAVPVFSPYGYDLSENLRQLVPKTLEMLRSGARKMIFDREFQELALEEIGSSLSKTMMINRVRRFLPKIDANKITVRGTAGIRSSVIDDDGKFVPDIMLENTDMSFHILNYNSPGATGVLPFSAHVIDTLNSTGIFCSQQQDAKCGPWQFSEILARLC